MEDLLGPHGVCWGGQDLAALGLLSALAWQDGVAGVGMAKIAQQGWQGGSTARHGESGPGCLYTAAVSTAAFACPAPASSSWHRWF